MGEHVRLSTSIKSALVGVVAAAALAIPAGASTATAASPAETKVTATGVGVEGVAATCKHKSRKHIVRQYFRGPAKFTLRCGTKKWGWKHIKAGHGWNKTMDKRIRAAIWSGEANGRGGYSTYANACPRTEKFRTLLGTPAARNDLRTAYRVTRFAATC
ncbi:hypothetical protein [Streptomyces sp. ODS28]|uniref:hypothetical protein n=1 Tax=Streptomyces sp. ODS28 TaxID=3136688 RepID=UPI0031EC54AA